MGLLFWVLADSSGFVVLVVVVDVAWYAGGLADCGGCFGGDYGFLLWVRFMVVVGWVLQ